MRSGTGPRLRRACGLPLRCVVVGSGACRVVLAIVLCGLLWPTGARADAPANDDFAGARALVTGVAVSGDTSEASAEVGEPVHSTGNGPNRSVWFTWTPQSGGLARISACGSAFDTVVAVYGGSALQGIFFSKLANNDGG